MNIGKISAENFAIRQNSAKTTNNHLSKHNASSPYSELSKASSLDILANQKRAFVEKSPNVQKISFGANLSKIPEFLYHVTSKASANSILTSGKILPNVESATGLKGVFAFDMFLMPSLFEPCGISQLIAMKYGSVPIVRAVGGLDDTVVAYPNKDATGFKFLGYDAQSMVNEVKNAIWTYYDRKDDFKNIVNNCLNAKFSWEDSAKKYKFLYLDVLNKKDF